MQLGSFGDLPFTVLRQPTAAGRTHAWSFAQHDVAGGKSRLEATGVPLQEVTLRLRLTAIEAVPAGSVDPQADLDQLVSMGTSRQAFPLFVGSAYWGRFVIEQLREDVRRTSPHGPLLSVDVELTLREHDEPAAADA